MKRVIVAGGRNFNDYELLKKELISLKEKYKDLEIVSGNAKGADMLGERFSRDFNCRLRVFQAKWNDLSEPCLLRENRYGKYNALAGIKRNEQMLQYAKEDNGMLLAFWDGKSRGTNDMINRSRKAGLEVKVVKY